MPFLNRPDFTCFFIKEDVSIKVDNGFFYHIFNISSALSLCLDSWYILNYNLVFYI